MTIAIFGAGVAGLMCAIALASKGYLCTIYERNPEANDDGMGLILLPDAIDCLAQYGICVRERANSAQIDQYNHRDCDGQVLHSLSMPSGSLGIRRRDLMAAMVAALPANIEIVRGALEKIELDGSNHVTAALLTSGERAVADLYLAADGVRSIGRRSIFPEWPLPNARILELVGVALCPNAVRWSCGHLNKFHTPLGGLAFGILPMDAVHVVWYLQFDSTRYCPPSDCTNSRQSFASQLVGKWGGQLRSYFLQRTSLALTYGAP